MTVQIDDAGYGSLIGPTFIGAYRKETGEFVYGEVPLHFFRHPVFQSGEYLREATRVVRELLDQLHSTPEEPLEICTGNIFDDVEISIGHPVHRGKIDGYLQKAIEDISEQYLLTLGIPIAGVKPGARHFRICLDWLVADYPARECFVKTGGDKWPNKWRPIVSARAARARSTRAQRETHSGHARNL